MPHVDAHPRPTNKPELPASPGPDATREERAEYRRKTDLYNAWVLALRRHAVAKALDDLDVTRAMKGDLGPVECIVYVLGISWLEDSTAHSVGGPDLFSIFSRML